MQGDPRILEVLTGHARDEVTAITSYLAHHDQAERLGLPGLHDWLLALAKEEMGHLGKLSARIYLLGGKPDWSPSKPPEQDGGPVAAHQADLALEQEAVDALRLSVELCEQLKDQDTGDLLRSILADETRHADGLEAKLAAVDAVGEQNYLSGYLAMD